MNCHGEQVIWAVWLVYFD